MYLIALIVFVIAVVLGFLAYAYFDTARKRAGAILLVSVVTLVVESVLLFGGPYYAVFQQKLVGEAEFKRAEQNRKIKIEEARAQKEAAVMLAEAEIERAKGVAKANAIIGDSLKGNEAYLRYLWIDGLHKNQQTIYVATEAGLPILEAGRLKKAD